MLGAKIGKTQTQTYAKWNFIAFIIIPFSTMKPNGSCNDVDDDHHNHKINDDDCQGLQFRYGSVQWTELDQDMHHS